MSIQARPLSFGEQSFQDKGKKTKKEIFFDEMERVVPWKKSSQRLNPITIAQAIVGVSPIRCR